MEILGRVTEHWILQEERAIRILNCPTDDCSGGVSTALSKQSFHS